MLHGNIHRHLMTLSLANWALAVVCWSISAYMGIARPTSMFIYTILFVVGLFAVLVAIGAYLIADFGTEPAAAAEPAPPAGPPTAESGTDGVSGD